MNLRPFARILVQRPKTIILIFTIITALVGSQAVNLYMESNFSNYLPQDDPTLVLWKQINREFQLGSTIIIMINQTDKINLGYYLRDPRVLQEMDDVGRAIDYDKGTDDGVASVQSLAAYIRNENAKSIIEGGRNENKIPDDVDLIHDYEERLTVRSIKGVLYTNDYKYAVIIIQLSPDADYNFVLENVQKAIENRASKYCNMEITGSIAMQKAIQKNSMSNLVLVFPIALVLVSIVILYFHRSFKGIIIAFLPPAFALALTFGIVGIINPELSIISVAVVALLMGLGVDYSIHLMNRILEEKTLEDKITRVEKTLKSTGKAVLLSTITTIIGFSSLMISSMSPMVMFGFASAIGILFCFISAIILVPCLVTILKFDRLGSIPSWKKFANFAIKFRGRILVIAIFFAIMSIILLPQVKTDVNYNELSPKGIPEVETMNLYSKVFGGGANFNAVIVETDYQGFLDPSVIEAIYSMEEDMRNEIAKVFLELDDDKIEKSVYSIVDEIKKISDMLNKSAITQRLNEILKLDSLFLDRISREGFNIIDEDFSKTLIMISIPVNSSIEKKEAVVNEINEIVAKTNTNHAIPFNGHVSIIIGQDAVTVEVNKKLSDEQTRSMIIAIILVLAALIVIFNSTKFGAVTLVPVAFVLLWEPGFLVAFDISLSVVTISIASIMIGIGIDYGVHITQRVRDGLAEGLSKTEATREAINKTGLSLIEASLTTIAGISAIFFVNIPALQYFSLVIILMTAFSFIAAALILPVFLCSKETE